MSLRTDRLAELIQREVSQIIQSDVKDARIGFVTVTRADIAPDLKNARVYITVLGDLKTRNATFRGLKSASGYISSQIGDRLHLKFCPRIEFIEDQHVLDAFRIDELLKQDRQRASAEEKEQDQE